MLLELEKYKEDIFQQAINFWYNLDNESQVNISNGYKLILENWKECHYFWMDGWIRIFYRFFLQNAIGYEQDYINFLINERYNIIKNCQNCKVSNIFSY